MGIQPTAGLKPDLLPTLRLIVYNTCIGCRWRKGKLSGVLYGRGSDIRKLVVPVNNLSHHFCLSGSPFSFLLSVISHFPSSYYSSLLGIPVTRFWYLKLILKPDHWPLGIPILIIILLHILRIPFCWCIWLTIVHLKNHPKHQSVYPKEMAYFKSHI